MNHKKVLPATRHKAFPQLACWYSIYLPQRDVRLSCGTARSRTDNLSIRGRPNFGFGFGVKCGQMDTFGGHSVSAKSSRTTCKDNRGNWLRCLRLHLVLWALTGWHYNGTIDFRFGFRFSAENKLPLSVDLYCRSQIRRPITTTPPSSDWNTDGLTATQHGPRS